MPYYICISYIFIDKNGLGGERGAGGVVGWLVVSLLYEREVVRVRCWAGDSNWGRAVVMIM